MDGVLVIVSVSLVVLAVFIVPATITALKGKQGVVIAGVFLHPCWWVGAIRLARPNSYWARRFYGQDKLRRAKARFPDIPMPMWRAGA